MKKDTIWVCKGCPTENCLVYGPIDTRAPSNCTIGLGWKTNWQKTTDYEIVRKSSNEELVKEGIEETFKKPDLEGITIPAPPDPPPKRKICEDIRVDRPTPNCSICEWNEGHYCSAQGGKSKTNQGVYNSKECKRLFSTRDNPTCEPPEQDMALLHDLAMKKKADFARELGGIIDNHKQKKPDIGRYLGIKVDDLRKKED